MTLVPRSDRKRVYALLSFIPAVLFYLVLLAYMYLGNFTALVDGVLYASVIGETAVLTIILTKLKVCRASSFFHVRRFADCRVGPQFGKI